MAPATLSSTGVTLVWQKPRDHKQIKGYRVSVDGQISIDRSAAQTHVTLTGLTPETSYTIKVTTLLQGEQQPDLTAKLSLTTKPAGQVVDFIDAYAADTTGKKLETANLQRAIDLLPKDGTLLIPEGAVILTGAIDLKSDMTLKIDGTLKGSLNPEDYTYTGTQRQSFKGKTNRDGFILTRYEGWEMYCYRSLINAGYLDPDNRLAPNCQNLKICGKGTIYGGGNQLGTAMKKLYSDKEAYPEYVSDGIGGRRTRGRLISLIQCQNVDLEGITVQNPPCWTIHMIYCDGVATHAVHIKSQGVDNGDGWDPDSSRNCMIFDTTFDTGDDCVAVKSGKNPEGNKINIPCVNIRVFDLQMTGGHGMAVGSEESGGVENISVADCSIQNTDSGIELKANASRGGYIKNFSVEDCTIDSLLIHSVQYNSDGDRADQLPKFENINLKNVKITGNLRDFDVTGHPIGNRNKAVELIGFSNPDNDNDDTSYVSDVHFENVTLDNPKNTFMVDCAKNIYFKNVITANKKPLSIQLGSKTRNIVLN